MIKIPSNCHSVLLVGSDGNIAGIFSPEHFPNGEITDEFKGNSSVCFINELDISQMGLCKKNNDMGCSAEDYSDYDKGNDARSESVGKNPKPPKNSSQDFLNGWNDRDEELKNGIDKIF